MTSHKTLLVFAKMKSQQLESLLMKVASHQSPVEKWRALGSVFETEGVPFATQSEAFHALFGSWDGPAPAWTPTSNDIAKTHLEAWRKDLNLSDYDALHRWSVENRSEFWERVVQNIGLVFEKSATRALGNPDPERPDWFSGASLNITESCLAGSDEDIAVIHQEEGGTLHKVTYKELKTRVDQVAHAIHGAGFQPGDALAIDMAMNFDSVVLYLAIVRAGCVVVSIADSFAPNEIAVRLKISKAKAIFCQDWTVRGAKTLPLYQKVVDAQAPRAIVLPSPSSDPVSLREGDESWADFLKRGKKENFAPVMGSFQTPVNILFSSGTTGEPKAIVWDSGSALKGATDGYFHHDIHKGDVVAWPTNLGWMMGPWLIYAGLINRASIALYGGVPLGEDFGRFVVDAKVSMLGLVPSLVKAWRASGCMESLDWSCVRRFSSTGECSNADDYLYLMSLAGYAPVIEYCGGTEIGGGYITGAMVQPASPATFTTAAMGLDFYILDEAGNETEQGELFLVPPSVGLSTTLLNRDHHEVYFKDAPQGPKGETLRRHGDEIQRLPNGYFRGLGRVDDTMNLGGIKVSSAQIERVLNSVEGVVETAAIAVPSPGGGPSLLVVYVVGKGEESLKETFQKKIRTDLNPLFKVHDCQVVEKLPRTASNKVMRRVLRAQYIELMERRGA